jgi:hypothetical protein
VKKLLVFISRKKLYRILIFLAASTLLAGSFIIAKTGFFNAVPVSDGIEADEIASLEKDNSKLKGILKSILPENNRVIYEDQYRNRFINARGHTPASFKTFPLQEVLKKGMDTKFNVLSNDPYYLRLIYDPSWKGAYYRGWLNLPNKNIDARHRLFIYPSGASSIYDFTGTLGIDNGTAVNYHKNINFLIYGFDFSLLKYRILKQYGLKVRISTLILITRTANTSARYTTLCGWKTTRKGGALFPDRCLTAYIECF